jgi:alpha-mannosidase
MKLSDASILLSCQSLDDFPVNHDGAAADGLLAAWTSLWHPTILANIGKIPGWIRVEDLSPSQAGRFVAVPSVSSALISDETIARMAQEGGICLRVGVSRDDLLSQVLPKIDRGEIFVDPELVADFHALGYCYLQIELLTRRMRYSSGLSQTNFAEILADAAQGALNSDGEAARAKLRSCFDQLTQEREHYYAVEVFLLDIGLAAEGLAPRKIQDQLAWSIPTNLLISGQSLARFAADQPELVAMMREAIQSRRMTIIGGEHQEQRLPLISSEAIHSQIAAGLKTCQEILGCRPTVFGRRRFGLGPALPQMLRGFNFQSALHATLDDGQFPQAHQTKSRWEGKDGSTIDAIMRAPLDASAAATFLNLAGNISDAMDMDHVASRCFAHWAGTASPWYAELRRVAKYTSALGRFVLADDYFRDTYIPGSHERFTISQYRSPYLKQAVDQGQPDPISSVVEDWRSRAAIDHLRRWAFLCSMVGTNDDACRWPSEVERLVSAAQQSEQVSREETSREIAILCRQLTESLAAKLVPSTGPPTRGTCILNTASHAVRDLINARAVPNPTGERDAVYAVGETDEAVVDVPGMGFVWLPEPVEKKGPKRRSPTIAVDNVLRNEFLEAVIDPTSGGLRSIRDFDSRGSRLTQQIAVRMDSANKDDGRDTQSSPYSRMVADRFEVPRSDSLLGEISVHGRLMGKTDEVLAEFSQRYHLRRGSRVLHVHATVDPRCSFGSDPWTSYAGLRFMWPNEASELHVGINDLRQPMSAKRFESPLFVEIDDAVQRTAILCGGLPFHVRTGPRSLDTLLLVAGETARSFAFGIGIDLKNPFREAHEILGSSIQTTSLSADGRPTSGWLFHVNARNVRTTSWRRLELDDAGLGVQVRLIETEGKSTKMTLSAFCPVVSARKVDFQGETLDQCQVSENQINFSMHENEWTQIEARLAKTGS